MKKSKWFYSARLTRIGFVLVSMWYLANGEGIFLRTFACVMACFWWIYFLIGLWEIYAGVDKLEQISKGIAERAKNEVYEERRIENLAFYARGESRDDYY